MKMKPNCLHILYEVEWPPVGAGWPPENTMNLKIVEAVHTGVTGEPGHLNPEGKRKNINDTKIDR